jgi:hypothetical protein
MSRCPVPQTFANYFTAANSFEAPAQRLLDFGCLSSTQKFDLLCFVGSEEVLESLSGSSLLLQYIHYIKVLADC